MPKNRRFLFELFAVPPETWCVRGEPYLWEAMRDYFHQQQIELPASRRHLHEQLSEVFELFTGHSVNEREHFYVDKFAHGGMSGGYIEPECC